MGNNSSSTMPASFIPSYKIANDMPSTPKKPPGFAFNSSSQWKIHFEASKESTKLMVIDFTASWCGPCKLMEPAINEYAAHYFDVEFVKIDVDKLPDVAKYFEVQTMPTFVLVKSGNVVDKIVGADKETLKKKIEKNRITN